MITPYDWQEGMSHRTAYVQGRLAAGTPVLMLSIKEGILAYAVQRQARKIFEIYDKLIFGAIGQQSDVEAMRVASIEFTHQEGFNRSEDDVTIARVVAALTTPLKRAFSDFNSTPFVVQSLFAEVGSNPAEDWFYLLDFDGDYSMHRHHGFLAGDPEQTASIHPALIELFAKKPSLEEARAGLREIWHKAMDPQQQQTMDTMLKNLREEIVLLHRSAKTESRFQVISP